MTGESKTPANQGITEQNERLQFALQAADVGTWDLDIVNQQVWWDDRCKQLYGFRHDDVVPYEQVLSYMHPDDAGRVDQAVRWALNPQSAGQYDVQFRTIGASDGQLRWLHCRGKAFFDGHNVAYRFSGIAQDITSLVQTRSQLATFERRFDSLVVNSPTATVIFVGRDMVVQAINQPMLTIWGKDASAVGKPLHEAMPELIGQPFLELLQHVYDTGEVYRNPEGKADIVIDGQLQEFWFNFSYNPLYDESGAIYGVINTATDVTAQVAARRQLAEREAQLKAIINEAPVAIGVYAGPDNIVEQCNQSLVELIGSGLAMADIVGKPFKDLIPEPEEHPLPDLIARVYATRQSFRSYNLPVRVVRMGVAHHEFYNINYVPLLDASGQSYAVLGIAVDVTGEVTLRQQIEQAQHLLQQAVDLAQLATWQVDVPTDTARYSERKGEWLGQSNQATMPTVLTSIAPDDRERVAAAFSRAYDLRSGGRLDIEYRVSNRRTGEHRILHSIGQAEFDESGSPIRLAGISQDVTEQRSVQLALERLVQLRTEELAAVNEELSASNEELAANNEEYLAINEELESANGLLLRSNDNLQTFAYIASHDLQEPLRKIQQFGDLLQSQYAEALGDGMTYLTRMQTAASRMSTLIRDLLSFSRISTQRNVTEPVPLQLIISDVLTVLELVIAETGAQMSVDALPIVSGDPAQLGQLFQNLLSNAFKFRRPDATPRIRISSQLLSVDALPSSLKPARRADYYTRIDVADNGIGFNEKYLDRIFQVFQRLHGRSEYSGTGIGLAICEKVAANHGGAITASSQPGQGATFSVYLPA